MMPDFLGLGAPRCGTTWLHELLASHPQVYVPRRRKELNYFDKRYGKGRAWYEAFFAEAEYMEPLPRAVGELTPTYLFSADACERIARAPEIQRFIVLLRNPADWLCSQYGWALRYGHFKGDLAAFRQERPQFVAWARYADWLDMYFSRFDRARFLILLYEESVRRGLGETERRLADFLGIDPGAFPSDSGGHRVNAGTVSRLGPIFHLAARTRKLLHDHDLDWVVNFAKKAGLKSVLLLGSKRETVSATDREELLAFYDADITRLEDLLGRSLASWRGCGADGGAIEVGDST
jgi:Sulfotransferase domain